MNKTPVALQLFSVRGEVGRDLPGTLKTLAKIGYDGAEPFGYDGKTLIWQGHSAADIRKMYDENGLTCCGIHLATDALLGDNLKRTIEFNKTVGNRFLIVAADKGRMSSSRGIAELAGILNTAAKALQPEGLYTGYHAHGFDFTIVNGRPAWDTLFAATEPEVIMQMDIGNCASGGGDPIATLRKFPGRARTMHLKDFGGGKDSVIGEGTMDWPVIVEICRSLQRPEWYVIEEGSGDGFDIPERSLKAVRKLNL